MRASPLLVLGAVVALSACGSGGGGEKPCAGAACEAPEEGGLEVDGLGRDAQGRYLVDFGNVAVGRNAVQAVSLHNGGAQPIEVRVSGSIVPFQVPDAVRIDAGGDTQLQLAWLPIEAGAVEREVMLTAGERTLQLLVRGAASVPVLSCDEGVDFGTVQGRGSRESSFTCRNDGAVAVQVSAEVEGGSFSVVETGVVELAPGASADWAVRYAPADFGPASGSAVLHDDRGAVLAQIPLTAAAESWELGLSCEPGALDFGPHVIGAAATLEITCTNGGEAAVTLDRVEASSPVFTAVATSGAIEPGAQTTIAVTFAPAATGPASGTLSIGNADGGVEIPVAGTALPPCEFEVTPSSLRFGQLAPGRGADLDLIVRNRGTGECLVTNLGAASEGGSFSLQAEQAADFTVPEGEDVRIPVHYAPADGAGVELGEITFGISDASGSRVSVPLRGGGSGGCLSVDPGVVDFANTLPGCISRDRVVTLVNRCDAPLTLSSIEVAEGPEFFVIQRPALPTTLSRGQAAQFSVTYRPTAIESAHGAVFVTMDGNSEPLHVALAGSSTGDPRTTDRFEPGAAGRFDKVDLLLVIDNTANMGAVQGFLADHLNDLITGAGGNDWRIGVTTAGISPAGSCPGGASGGEAGRLFPVDGSTPRFIDGNTPNLDAAWRSMVNVGTCQTEAKPLEAIRRALELGTLADDPSTPEPNDGNLGFFRRDAALRVLVVTGGTEASDPNLSSLAVANARWAGGWPPVSDLLRISTLLVDGTGNGCPQLPARLADLVQRYGGQGFDGCGVLGPQTLSQMTMPLLQLDPVFVLRGTPEDTNADAFITDDLPFNGGLREIELQVDGERLPSEHGTSAMNWEYDTAFGLVRMEWRAHLDPNSTVEVFYRNECL